MGRIFYRRNINESSTLNEIGNTPEGQFMLGRVKGRQNLRARGEQTSGRVKHTTVPAEKYKNGSDFEIGEYMEDYTSWEPPYSYEDIYADGGQDVGKLEFNDAEQDFMDAMARDLYNRVAKKLNSAPFLERQPELTPEIIEVLKEIKASLGITNESFNYVSKQGCIFDEYDLEDRYGHIEKELQRLGINATIEYPYCTEEKVTISIDSLAGKTAVDLCLQDNEYKFESMNRRGNKIFLTYTYDWDNSIFGWN